MCHKVGSTNVSFNVAPRKFSCEVGFDTTHNLRRYGPSNFSIVLAFGRIWQWIKTRKHWINF